RRGPDARPAANAVERPPLARTDAASDVRLACQIRPETDLTVEPLVAAALPADRVADRFTAAAEGGAEIPIAAMFVDLRQSTRLASGRLPYDAPFLFDRYIHAVTRPIPDHGGHLTPPPAAPLLR